jgi:hypothetical protein
MGDIRQKTLGFLVDELFTTLIKCWFAQEALMHKELSEKERLDAAIRTQDMNNRRNRLIRAIDEIAGQAGESVTTKSYAVHFDEKK